MNAVFPPLCIGGPFLTIRKFAADPLMMEDLIDFGTLTPQVAELLRACVEGKANIMVSGGAGTGKTTMLNVLSSFIPSDERIITIEDAKELQLHQDHVLCMEVQAVEHGGDRRGNHQGPAAQQPAYAPRPHHHRRVPFRRGTRHAASHEHRS